MERKEAIEVVKKNYPHCAESGTQFETALRTLIPELRESEDERIRKWIKKELENKYVEDGIVNNALAHKAFAWLEMQKPSDAALEYLKENHSPSEVSDFQAAMNIAVAKAYDRGIADAIKQDPCRTCDHPTMSCINFPCEKKKQAEQKPTEWSEEDERILLRLIAHFDWHGNTRFTKEDCQEATNWLKSIRPQPHWKPSEEQLKALRYFITSNLPRYNASTSGWIEFDNIQSLYNDLKKLREE